MCNRFRTIYLSGKLCTPGGKSIQVKYDQKSYSIKIILQEHYRHVIIELTILYSNSVPIKSSKFHFSSTRPSVFCDWSFCLRKGLNCLHTYMLEIFVLHFDIFCISFYILNIANWFQILCCRYSCWLHWPIYPEMSIMRTCIGRQPRTKYNTGSSSSLLSGSTGIHWEEDGDDLILQTKFPRCLPFHPLLPGYTCSRETLRGCGGAEAKFNRTLQMMILRAH